jgi:hypothetical protein
MLFAQWTEYMVKAGETPYFWQNYQAVGGVEYDNKTYAKYLKRGY